MVLVGVVLATGAILSLGRSFGIEAANRGIQTHGLYRFVRHPIYAAYLPLMGGYLLASCRGGMYWCLPAGWLPGWVGFDVRKPVLRRDPQYQAYTLQVRWRLLPGIW